MDTSLRVATFNLENLDDGRRARPPLGERIPLLRRELEALAADILCLQEVNAQQHGKHGERRLAALDAVLAGTRYESYHRAATGHDDGRPYDVHNLVILSRLPIVERHQHRHTLIAPPTYRPATATPPAPAAMAVEWDRPLLHARIALGARRLDVVNLHLRAPLATPVAGQKATASSWRSVAGWAEGFLISTIKRAGQAVEARLLVDRLFDAAPDAWILVAGDLNAEPHETPLRALLGEVADTGNAALADRRLVALAAAVPAEQRYSVRHAGKRVLLDHLLASPALACCHATTEIRNAELLDEDAAARAGIRPSGSFHAAVVAEFTLSDEAAPHVSDS